MLSNLIMLISDILLSRWETKVRIVKSTSRCLRHHMSRQYQYDPIKLSYLKKISLESLKRTAVTINATRVNENCSMQGSANDIIHEIIDPVLPILNVVSSHM
jgi:hypothetical protein